MKFWKMHGAGNDFIVVDNIEERIPEERLPDIARIVCKSHISVGSDGLMTLEEAREGGDFRMVFYNPDGSIEEMCGNGVRCLCRYGYENGLAGEIQKVETDAGLVTGWRMDKRNYKVRLNDPSIIELNKKGSVDGKEYVYSYIELGDPGIAHAVIEIPGLRDIPKGDLFELGRKWRYYKDFPKGANVNFYDILGEDHFFERTWERGVEDFSFACGTGTGATVTILTMLGKVSGKDVQVDVEGGRLVIDLEMDGDKITDIYLSGPTNIVLKGEITDEDLSL